jgi:hypothetical protein
VVKNSSRHRDSNSVQPIVSRYTDYVTVSTDDMGKTKNGYEILVGKFESKVTALVILPNEKLIIKDMLEKYNMSVCMCVPFC